MRNIEIRIWIAVVSADTNRYKDKSEQKLSTTSKFYKYTDNSTHDSEPVH